MAEEDEMVPYKDISDLKKELEGMKGRKDISVKELYDAVQRLAQTMTDMLEVFGAAAEQMKLEEQSYDSSAKKHEMIISKLDKVNEQNKTIAEGMVAIVEMVKERLIAPAREREEPMFRPRPEPRPFMKPQTEWQPKPEPVQRTQPMPMNPPPMPPMAPMPMATPASSDFGMQMPPTPSPDLDFPDLGLDDEEEPKKKGIFGMFKK